MSVCLCVCHKNFVASVARELMHSFMKLYVQSYTTIHWCLLTFGENRSTDGAAITPFSRIFGINLTRFLLVEIAQKCLYNINMVKDNSGAI